MPKLNDFKVKTFKIEKNVVEIELTNGMGMSMKSDEDVGVGDVQIILSTLVNNLYAKFPNIGYDERGGYPQEDGYQF